MLRVLIVDDELPARRRLGKLLMPLQSQGRVEITAEAEDGFTALSTLRENEIDLLFLDIQMPGMNGFDVLERLPGPRRPIVVFTTAHDAYAIRAFEANAIDYLLKPISGERLEESVGRAERTVARTNGNGKREEDLLRLLEWLDQQAMERPRVTPPNASYMARISVPHKDRMIILPIDSVLSIEAQDGITRLYSLDERSDARQVTRHIVNYTLDQMESQLDPEKFMRVHRSAIIQLDQIKEIIPWFSGRCKLLLNGGHEVVASRTRSKELKEKVTP